MDILKSLLLSLLIMFSVTLLAQNDAEVQRAFAKSYELEKAGAYQESISALLKVVDEEFYEANLRLGWLYYLSGDYSESVKYYSKCIELKPLSIEARLGIVNPEASMGNMTKVENIYNDILKIDPQNSLALYRIGYLYYNREDYKTALSYFEKVLNHYPFDFSSINMTAWTYYQLGEYRKAKVLFNKALLNDPDNEIALEGLKLIK